MAKKQVGVSLRKPPPADTASLAAVASASESGVHASADTFVAGSSQDKSVDANAARLAQLRDAALETTPAPVSAEIFVSGSDGRALRELTLLLPKDLAQKLAIHCIENDCDVSNVIADAVAKHLDKQNGASVAVKPAGTRPAMPPTSTTTTTAKARHARTPIAEHVGRAIDLIRARLFAR